MNNKGGCGKTTTSIALGMYLVRKGYNVLFWDNDPQSNLTQRLGLPDDKYRDKRIGLLFKYADVKNSEKEKRRLSYIIEYPYLMRLKGGTSKAGKVGLMAGDHNSEIDANSAQRKLMKDTFSDLEYRDIFAFFRNSVKFYCSYFDYIIIDTAPALEGNILNIMSVRTADEIICPIDGIEAAFGVRYLLTWMNSETRPEYSGLNKQPNVLFAMVKYQADTKNIATAGSRLRNVVFRAMKESFGDFVCDKGVTEQRKLRSVVAGFGRKTDYTELSMEIINKISQPRENIFSYANADIFKEFASKLAKVEVKILPNRPEFKVPYYATDHQSELDNDVSD